MAETKAQTIDSNERNKSLSNPKANLDMTLPSSYFANNPYFFQGQNTTSSAQPNNLFILPNYKNSNKTQKPAQLELPDFISFSVNSLDWNKMKSHIPHTFDILQLSLIHI